jgi:hypothetical protein
MRFKLSLLLLFITTILSAQVWQKSELRNKWGDTYDYAYNQLGVCTGRGSNGAERWRFIISCGDREGIKLVRIGIYPIQKLQMPPIISIIDEPATISLKEGNSTQAFQGYVHSGTSDTSKTSIICGDQKLITALQRNSEFTILVEGRNGSWYVRADIKGNMPKE